LAARLQATPIAAKIGHFKVSTDDMPLLQTDDDNVVINILGSYYDVPYVAKPLKDCLPRHCEPNNEASHS
jgi:hypothetical protein